MSGALGKIGLLPSEKDDHSGRDAQRQPWGQGAGDQPKYKPRPVSDIDLQLMDRIDKLRKEFPFSVSLLLLVQEGVQLGRIHLVTLMKRLGGARRFIDGQIGQNRQLGTRFIPICWKPPNQVGAMDMTYILMVRNFTYLAAVLD